MTEKRTDISLNEMVAKYVMGWHEWESYPDDYSGKFPMYVNDVQFGICYWLDHGDGDGYFKPSTRIEAAWLAIERIREIDDYWCPYIQWDDDDGCGQPHWDVTFQYFGESEEDYKQLSGYHDDVCVAICIAVLRVVGAIESSLTNGLKTDRCLYDQKDKDYD